MIIFHIPSWYPSRFHPYSGIFIKEYIEGYASQFPETLNIISNHVESYYPLSIKSPLESLKNVNEIFRQKTKRKIYFNRTANLIEVLTPIIWGISQTIFPFMKKKFLNIHEANFECSIKKYGKPDLIHAYISSPAGEMAYNLSKKFKIPYIITEHMGPFVPQHMLVKGKLPGGMLTSILNAAAIISVSHAHSKQIKKFIKRPVQVIPNAVNENLFYPENTVVQKTSPFTFLTVASTLHNSKGIHTLIKAIKICNDKGLNAVYKIGGSVNFFADAKLLADQNNIDNIIWFGMLSRQEVSRTMQECNAFVLPSMQESFGVVYAEAIATGKPIIVTKCGGPEDIVNEINGLLVPVDDAEALSIAMQNMITNYHNYHPVSIRNDFLNRFSIKAVTSQYHKLYRDIIG